MWYEKEYTFFKNIAERFRLPVHEIRQSAFSMFWNDKAGIYFLENNKEKGYEIVQHIVKNCPEQKVICVQDNEENVNMFFLHLPAPRGDSILCIGPFMKKDFMKAYCITVELAEVLWNGKYEYERHYVSFKQMHPLIEKVLEEIKADVTGDHTLRSISKKMSVSPGHLSKLFTQELGISLTEYVNRKKIEYGAYLLNTTEDKICCVAVQCGMPDNNYFSRLFKRYVGISPAEYRKKGVAEKINV